MPKDNNLIAWLEEQLRQAGLKLDECNKRAREAGGGRHECDKEVHEAITLKDALQQAQGGDPVWPPDFGAGSRDLADKIRERSKDARNVVAGDRCRHSLKCGGDPWGV